MKTAVFLDVDKTLILNHPNSHINQQLLDKLKEHGLRDIYLFSNMDLADISQKIEMNKLSPAERKELLADDYVKITRNDLEQHLIKQQFKVHKVITPADKHFNKGLGKPYEELYKSCIKIKDQKELTETYGLNNEEFKACLTKLKKQIDEEPNSIGATLAAKQKAIMFQYFLSENPGIKRIIYFDDDESCLQAVKDVNQNAGCPIDLKTCIVPVTPSKDAYDATLTEFTHIAFLDIDQTLLYDHDKVNYKLLERLKKAGIKDIYLFSNMGLEDIRNYSEHAPLRRDQLIAKIEEKGEFKVRGVITPGDLAHRKNGQLQPVGSVFRDIYSPWLGATKSRGKSPHVDEINIKIEFSLVEIAVGNIKRIAEAKATVVKPVLSKLIVVNSQTRETEHTIDSINNIPDEIIQRVKSGVLTLDKAHYEIEKEPLTPGEIQVAELKGLMMLKAVEDLGLQHHVKIHLFDDQPTHLVGCQKAINYCHRQLGYSTVLYSCQTAKTWSEAQNMDYAKMLQTPSNFDISFCLHFLAEISRHPVTKITAAVVVMAGITALCIASCGVLPTLSLGFFVGGGVATGLGLTLGTLGLFAQRDGDESAPRYRQVAPNQ